MMRVLENIRSPGEQEAFRHGYNLGYEHGRAEGESARMHLALAQGFARYVGIAVMLAVVAGIVWFFVKG